MIKLTDLKFGIISLMKTKFPDSQYNYYSKMVLEAYERPSFFIRLVPVVNERVSINFRSKVYALYITYYQKKLDEAEQLDMVDEIEKLFGNYIRIGNRAVDVRDFEFEHLGNDHNILEITVNLEWMDRIEHEITEPVMKTAEINSQLMEE